MPNEAGEPNGFRECWGALSDPDPHVLDLYRIDLLGGNKKDAVAEMAALGQAHLNDVSHARLRGKLAARQSIQLDYTRRDEEWISESLSRILAKHPYPLFFIDFEASRLAILYYIGMRPYEIAAFQWSVHKIESPSAEVTHAEWLNTDDAFPNFEFARQLKNHIGETGTVYIWSHYELDVLREIRRQLTQYNVNDPELAAWLDGITAPENSRVVDLCDLAKGHYFHPKMKGSLSIKDVLPACWRQNKRLREIQPFSKFLKYENNEVSSPYSALPPLPIGNREEVVNEGTGAMRVYQEMMFGLAKSDDAVRKAYRKLLLQYCELDTAAMVFIWMHWLTSSPN